MLLGWAMKQKNHSFYNKELELPETIYVRDIENRVFQSIVLQCLTKIPGVRLLEGNFIDNIFGRSSDKIVKGIIAEQDPSNHSVNLRIELNICYGVPIPQKAEEIQTLVTQEITEMTGLHVACVHVVFKNIVLEDRQKPFTTPVSSEERKAVHDAHLSLKHPSSMVQEKSGL